MSILAGTEVGVCCSQDNGLTFQVISEQLGVFPAVSVAFGPGTANRLLILAAGIPGMVASSWDGGQTWQLSKLGLADALVTVLGVSPSFAQDGCILAGTAEDGIFRSTSSGRYWEPANFGLH